MPTWKLAYHANCWGPLGGDAVGVTSITRLAYRTFGDMRRAAQDIAEAGYEGIDFSTVTCSTARRTISPRCGASWPRPG